MEQVFYDKHSLFIKCDCATREQIHACLRQGIENYARSHHQKITCSFRVNMVENREGKSLGIAFAFITDPSIFYMIIGKNPDGSDRVEHRLDPTWRPVKSGDTTSGAWIDLLEEEEKKQPSTITVGLDPLITIPPYRLTPAQIAAKRERILADNKDKPDFHPDLVYVAPEAHLIISRAFVTPLDEKLVPNILKCKNVPNWVTKDEIKGHFRPYASDSHTTHERCIKGKRITDTYPYVSINNDRMAFVIFDPYTHDAEFALRMMRKVHLTKAGEEVTLLFSHSYRTARDTMNDIIAQPKLRPIS